MLEVRIHGALWKRATTRRAGEWRHSLEELNASNAIEPVDGTIEDAALELVRPPDDGYRIRLYRDGFDLVEDIELDRGMVQGFFDEYAATIRQLVHVDREAPVRGFEAIDYAKRVIHDEAASFLRETLDGVVRLELSDARRLFTLIFLVGTDLPEALVRYHRRHV